ncbi:MAG: hypothetical protein L0027_04555 [Candidatus Rokubacteria bacterium]|nr:hypothetical protein [Candidatus Rokubacteria bacterium]
MEQAKKKSLRQRWSEARPTKTVVFWFGVAAVAATMLVGFTWGGWVTNGTARRMVETSGEDAVIKRLAPICVLQSKSDPKQDQKLKEFKDVSAWQQGDYIKKQGWATMPGEPEPDGKVADACAKLL